MNTRNLARLAGASLAALGLSSAFAASTESAYKAPINAYGQPDIEGTWTNASLTVLERPKEYGSRYNLSEEEIKKIEGDEAKTMAAGDAPTDPKVKTTDLPYECGRGFKGAGCGYNSAWIDPGSTVMRIDGKGVTSFINTTADGRMPPLKAGVKVSNPYINPHYGQNPENQSLAERCLTSFGYSAGPVMLPLLYNNNYQIVQDKDTVAIWVEMVHDVRMIHLDAQHRTDGLRPWMGDSIGHYEGNTLVVETTNFPEATSFYGAWKELKVTERFTRVGPRRMLYQFKVEDPSAWDTSWGGQYEFSPSKGRIFEYACHEGNYALEGILAGARADEAKAAAAAAAQKTAAVPESASAPKKQ